MKYCQYCGTKLKQVRKQFDPRMEFEPLFDEDTGKPIMENYCPNFKCVNNQPQTTDPKNAGGYPE